MMFRKTGYGGCWTGLSVIIGCLLYHVVGWWLKYSKCQYRWEGKIIMRPTKRSVHVPRWLVRKSRRSSTLPTPTWRWFESEVWNDDPLPAICKKHRSWYTCKQQRYAYNVVDWNGNNSERPAANRFVTYCDLIWCFFCCYWQRYFFTSSMQSINQSRHQRRRTSRVNQSIRDICDGRRTVTVVWQYTIVHLIVM